MKHPDRKKLQKHENGFHSSLAELPPVNSVVAAGSLEAFSQSLGGTHDDAVLAAREAIAQARIRKLKMPSQPATMEDIVQDARDILSAMLRAAIRPVYNATGIVLHTGLGRSQLCPEAAEAVHQAASGAVQLEIDPETGQRGSRQTAVSGLLKRLTGAESAAVVNNCAGAILLCIAAIASGKEVIISRGELVEIGGAFRMPDILAAGGAKLVEVGTTNRTRISDYRKAITDNTGMILRCHSSNFAIIGFTESASPAELVSLGDELGIPVVEDQGSGSILAPELLGLGSAHGSLPVSVAAGYGLVTASGDKLLGGTQAGLILGKQQMVNQVLQHPLARAMRADKLCLAGLEATLRVYTRGADSALATIPTLRFLTVSSDAIARRARHVMAALRAVDGSSQIEIGMASETSQAGGGSIPGDALETTCLWLDGRKAGVSADTLAAKLRQSDPGIYGRIRHGAVLLDLRCIEDSQLDAFRLALQNALSGL
jgi:L-seryl-tRNA(Ser) seleniumtransferase